MASVTQIRDYCKENKIFFWLLSMTLTMENSAATYKLYGIPYLGSMAIELLAEERV